MPQEHHDSYFNLWPLAPKEQKFYDFMYLFFFFVSYHIWAKNGLPVETVPRKKSHLWYSALYNNLEMIAKFESLKISHWNRFF